jgi:hypothetical protein
MLRKKYEDKVAAEALLKASDLKWTVEYPGPLSNRSNTRYSATVLEDLKKLSLFPSTARENVADFLLRSAVEDTYIRQIVVVADTK